MALAEAKLSRAREQPANQDLAVAWPLHRPVCPSLTCRVDLVAFESGAPVSYNVVHVKVLPASAF